MNERIAIEKKPKFTKAARDNILGYSFIAPALVFFILFTVVPIVLAIQYSFMEYNGMSIRYFNDFANYKSLFKNTEFWESMRNVFNYVVMYVPASIFLSLGLAVLIDKKLKGTKIFRAIYYIPGLTSAIAAALVFKYLFNPAFGLFNTLFNAVGLPPLKWLEDPSTAMLCVVIMSLWMGSGGNMIIFFSALKGLSPELTEAARIDGASNMRIFWSIKFPLLRATTFFVLTMSLIGAFQLYDQILILTNGNHRTSTPVFQIYNMAFGGRRMGFASAQAVALFVVIMTITFVTQRFVKETY